MRRIILKFRNILRQKRKNKDIDDVKTRWTDKEILEVYEHETSHLHIKIRYLEKKIEDLLMEMKEFQELEEGGLII